MFMDDLILEMTPVNSDPVAVDDYQDLATTQVVMLGTGTPFPNPERSGPGVAIVVNDTPYIVDFGDCELV